MAALLTPAQERTRREAYRALAVLLVLDLTGKNQDDDDPAMTNAVADPAVPFDAANTAFPDDDAASGA